MGWITKTPSDRWRAAYRDPARSVRAKTFDRKEDATRWLVKVESSKIDGDYHDPALARVTFAALWADHLAHSPGLAPATLELYRREVERYLLPTFGSMPVGGITRKHVEDLVARLEADGVGAATIRASHQVLHRLLNRAVAGGSVARNVASGVELPKARARDWRPLEAEELIALVDATPDRFKALFMLMGWSGLRIGEALALQVADLDMLKRTVKVNKACAEVAGKLIVGPTKTDGSRRTVVVIPPVAQALADHVAAFVPKDGGGVAPRRAALVFSSDEGLPIRRSNLRRRVWLPALEKAGLVDRRDDEGEPLPVPVIHDLRHTAASLAIASGASVVVVSRMLGHARPSITLDVYARLFTRDQEQATDRVFALYQAALPPGSDANSAGAGLA